MIGMKRVRIALGILIAIVAGVGSASAVVSGSGDDTAGGPEALQPDGGPVVVAVRVAAPQGEPAWAVRIYRSKTGLTCPELGRVDDLGRFGVAMDGKFVPLTVQASGSCADLSEAPLAVAINRYAATDDHPSRRVAFGATSGMVRHLAISSSKGSVPLTATNGGFLSVLPSGSAGLMLVAVLDDGTETRYSLDAPRSSALINPASPDGIG